MIGRRLICVDSPIDRLTPILTLLRDKPVSESGGWLDSERDDYLVSPAIPDQRNRLADVNTVDSH